MAALGENDIVDNIFGSDDREAITSREAPWKTIGRLSNGCTATLVGRNLALTAAHCALKPGKNELVSGLAFSPNVIDGSSSHTSTVTRAHFGAIQTGNTVNSYDWAILILADNLGDTYGWMGASADYGRYVNLAGYSADFRGGRTASVHRNCQVRQEDASFLAHDCDMTRGASGGPMFVLRNGSHYIVGVQSGERRNGGESSLTLGAYSLYNANTAVPASRFLATLRQLKGE